MLAFNFAKGCLISLFYIKPQPVRAVLTKEVVVLYPYSTSNHNFRFWNTLHETVVLYPYSTSNHNKLLIVRKNFQVVLYPYSTSNHNRQRMRREMPSVVLYPYSTSNHNSSIHRNLFCELSYILILHQTTTYRRCWFYCRRCLISLFYIKPQRRLQGNDNGKRCLISLFYIKPQLLTFSYNNAHSCLISLFYIKPQQSAAVRFLQRVVLYPYSTSNHNLLSIICASFAVVLYPYSTSNHNCQTL